MRCNGFREVYLSSYDFRCPHRTTVGIAQLVVLLLLALLLCAGFFLVYRRDG